MITNNLESKLNTKEHRKAYRKYRKIYKATLRHINNGEKPMNPQVAALGKAVIAIRDAHGLIPYDVQLLSAIILMDGGVLEVSTGEGKTLVAGMAACALSMIGRQVHIYTPNDYLSERDSHFTAKFSEILGVNCSYVTDETSSEDKKNIFHNHDIVYATEKSVIFSYINDNANLSSTQDILPAPLDFLIIDEADSILIDNGETPYILSGQGDNLNEYIPLIMPFAKMLDVRLMDHSKYESFKANPKDCHAIGNLHTKDIMLLDKSYSDLEKYLVKKGVITEWRQLYKNALVGYIDALRICLISLHTYQKDVNYVVEKGKILVVDEHTGRILPTVRMNSGIHQGIEAKEGVDIKPDSHTKGKVTLEGFVSRYKSIAGMSGTAIEVDEEMRDFYNLRVYCIPNNEDPQRSDYKDKYFVNKDKKYEEMTNDIKRISQSNRPVLVGASSVEEAENISKILSEKKVKHVLLTPKNEKEEASVISQAGRPGRITVTTNMAGRGTDISLGFNEESFMDINHTIEENSAISSMAEQLRSVVIDAGGLHVIGTERSRSPRVDRQLMGRAGRQGDPGSSQFYVSPDDKIFMAMGKNIERLRKLFSEPNNPLVRSSCRRAIHKIQTDIRLYAMEQKRQLRKAYGVHEQQMYHYYGFRNEIKYGTNEFLEEWLKNVVFRGIQQLVLNYVDYDSFDTEEISRCELDLYYFVKFVMYVDVEENEITTGKYEETATNIYTSIMGKIGFHMTQGNSHEFISLVKESALDACDECWVQNIARVEDINKTIHFRSYAGEKPDIKYQTEAFKSYKVMVVDVLVTIVSRVSALLSVLDEQDKRKIA